MAEMRPRLLECGDAAVDDDLELRAVALEAVDARMVERRNLAVLLRRQAGEDGLAGVDDEGPAAGRRRGVDETEQETVIVAVVDADAGLFCEVLIIALYLVK